MKEPSIKHWMHEYYRLNKTVTIKTNTNLEQMIKTAFRKFGI
jgi:hypothetical protein